MTRGMRATHSKIIGGADDTGRKGSRLSVPRLGEVEFEVDDIGNEVFEDQENMLPVNRNRINA